MRRSIAGAALGLLLATGTAAAQTFSTDNPVLRRIWTIGMDSSQTYQLSQSLFDSIGPRLTGSPGYKSGSDWLIAKYQSWGVEARAEQYGTWRGWRRGPTHLDLLTPRVRSLEAVMLAWSPGTPKAKPVRGSVVILPDVQDSTGFASWLKDAKGKFVLVSFPQPTCRPDTSWAHWGRKETVDSLKARRTAAQQAWTQRIARLGFGTGSSIANPALWQRLERGGVAGIITSFWSTGWGTDRIFAATTDKTPVLDVGCEDYGLLFRLAQNNQSPTVELTAQSQALGEVPVFNVLAEIKGSALPNEYVMLSAHFDSWDGGSGATDNGTGTVTMLEAMRILKQAYPNPRRTILVGHWSGEEQGLVGSKAWVHDHPSIVDSLQALFNQDNGTGRIESMSASGYPTASGNLSRYLAQIPADLTRDIKFAFPGSPGGGGTDHASFVTCGAPGFGLGSGDWDYFSYTWHTQRDTYDKISFDDLKMNATLVAMLAYLAAEDPQSMPRDRRTVFPNRPDGSPGGWPPCTDSPRATPPLVPPPQPAANGAPR